MSDELQRVEQLADDIAHIQRLLGDRLTDAELAKIIEALHESREGTLELARLIADDFDFAATTEHNVRHLETWARQILDEQVAAGRAPRNATAWLRATRRELARANTPDYVERVVAGIHARAEGKTLTRCRLVRGTHGITYEYDPHGTDEPPKWWSRDEARRRYEAEHG